MERAQVSFDQLVSRGCGLDVHKKVVTATIDGEGIKKQTREYPTITSSLKELRNWLLENGITHVAMESTGVFWKPVYNELEPAGLTVWIVNAAHIKYVPGHKTDKKDSAWNLQVIAGRLVKTKLYPFQRTTGAARPDALSYQINPEQCCQQKPDNAAIGRCQH